LQENFKILQHNPKSNAELTSYCKETVTKYIGYVEVALKQWLINDPTAGCIQLQGSALDYISFKESVTHFGHETPWASAVACYACYRLWPALANELGGYMSPPYKKWADDNKDAGLEAANELAKVVEASLTAEERETGSKAYERAKQVVLRALRAEVDFFNSVPAAPNKNTGASAGHC
jgi:thiaminase